MEDNVSGGKPKSYKGWIVVVLVLVLLAITNPSQADYTSWAKSKLMEQTDDKASKAAIEALGAPIIDMATTRTNYYICSVYKTEIENEKVVCLGILHFFIPLSSSK